MKKIKTLFKKDQTNLGRVTNEIDPEHTWVFTKHSVATRKFDGTSCAIINKELYKRFDLKPGRKLPFNAIACQEKDMITGHHPHWIKCERADPSNKWHFEGFDKLTEKIDGTYELCGPKIQGNPEKIDEHLLIKHGEHILNITDLSFEGIKEFLIKNDMEGVVFHHKIGENLCKIRKTDFGIKR